MNDDVIEVRASSARFEFVFHASHFSSLAYQMDCLAGIISCSQDAYRALWREQLGGLSTDDEKALEEWGQLKLIYRGQSERQVPDEQVGKGLPLLATGFSIGRLMRSAGYQADSGLGFAHDLALFVTPSDAERARALAERFEPRFEPFWRQSAPTLKAAGEGYARLLTQQLSSVVDQAAHFCGAELPNHAALWFDLVARPAHDSATHGELVGHRLLVEVPPGEKPSERVFVVLHEVFHLLHWSAKRADLAALATRILDLDDPLASPAYELLDEALAAAFGSGVVRRLANPADYQEHLGKPRGFYAEEFIDAAAQAVLPVLDAALAAGGSINDPDFATRYFDALKARFPEGIAPRAYLRSWVAALEPELASALHSLASSVRSTQTASTPSLDPRAVSESFEPRARWTHVVLVREARARQLTRLAPWIDRADAGAIARRARNGAPFVYAAVRRAQAPLLVFVAPDAEAMKALGTRFLAVNAFHNGVLTE